MRFWFLKSLPVVHEGCLVNFPTKVRNLEASTLSTVCWRESTRRVRLPFNQAPADRFRRGAVKDLALSQEDKPKKHRSPREISHETRIIRSSVHEIIHSALGNMLQTRSCSAGVWSQSRRPSNYVINNRNKSYYCSFTNSKLEWTIGK